MAEQYNLVSWLILIIFLVTVGLVISKKVSLLKTLPLAGIIIALVAGVPLVNFYDEDIASNVIVSGITDLAEIMLIYVLSMMFAQFVLQYKLDELIDYLFTYYLARRKQYIIWGIALFSIIVSSTLINIGAVLFVAILFLPILLKLGFTKPSAIALFLLAEGVGTCLNPQYHVMYAKLLSLPQNYVENDFYVIAFLSCVALIIFIMVNIYTHKLNELNKPPKRKIPVLNLLMLFTPLLLALLGFNIEIGLSVALIYGFLLEKSKSPVDDFLALLKTTLVQSVDVLILLGSIGIFISAMKTQAVAHAMVPLLMMVMPTSPMWCLVLFTVLFPLVLYKGLFNLQGMGAGISLIMLSSAVINPLLLGTVFLSLNILSKMIDPLSIKNVALFEYTQVDSMDIIKKIIPYVLGINYVMLFYMLVILS